MLSGTGCPAIYANIKGILADTVSGFVPTGGTVSFRWNGWG